MDFRNAYAHGFARVAACTLPVTMADPAKNAAATIEQARALHEDGVAVALFPELGLSATPSTVGECGECPVRLLSGKVEMSTPNCLSPANVEGNIVLTCIAKPTEPSSVELDYTLSHTGRIGTGFATWKDQT